MDHLTHSVQPLHASAPLVARRAKGAPPALLAGRQAQASRPRLARPTVPRHGSGCLRGSRVTARGLLDGLFGGGPALDLPSADPQFEQWLKQQSLPPQPKVALQEFDTAGRGLVAVSPIKEGETLLSVPEGLLITANVALKESVMGGMMKSNHLPVWTVLAIFLVELRHQASTTADTCWGEYIRRLPANTGCVLEWDSQEVEKLLAGTTAVHQARTIRAAAEASWQEAKPLVKAAEAAGTLPVGVVTREEMYWAFGILLSRLIRLPAKGNTEALVPWADFLNHSPTTASHLDWDGAAGAVVLRPDKTYAPGEQIYVSYGQRSSSELLLSYGFVPDSGTNPFDSISLELEVDESDPQYGLKKEVLEEYGLAPRETFPMRVNGWPAALIPYQALVLEKTRMTDEEIHRRAGHFFEAPQREAVKVLDAYSVLLAKLKAMLLDAEKCDVPEGTGSDACYRKIRAAQARMVRRSEERVLMRCEFILREQQRALRRQCNI